MAKIPGGITSRPSGQLGNIIFGAARTPEGKVATAREAVNPSNPDTPAQQAQRSKFQQAVAIVQALGPSIYQEDWNRSVGQLPGFQSWQSILLNNIDNADTLQPPSDRPLGNLHFPDTLTVSQGAATGTIDYSNSSEAGNNGTASDEIITAAIEADDPSSRDRDVVVPPSFETRSDPGDTISVDQDGTDYVVVVWLRGAGSAEGLLSTARFYSVTSAA